jgi:hypothetical protein
MRHPAPVKYKDVVRYKAIKSLYSLYRYCYYYVEYVESISIAEKPLPGEITLLYHCHAGMGR